MSLDRTPKSRLSSHSADKIYYRDTDLVEELLGRASFVDVFMRQAFGRACEGPELRMIEAILVSLMEHGLTPSAIASRLIYSSAPESLQARIAAGLLGVGSRFVGTMEECGEVLSRLVLSEPRPPEMVRDLVAGFKTAGTPIPGFGHHLHRPDEPRALKLIHLAQELGRSKQGLASTDRKKPLF